MLKLPRFKLLTLFLVTTVFCLVVGAAVTNQFVIFMLAVLSIALTSACLSFGGKHSPIISGFVGGYLSFVILLTAALYVDVLFIDEDEEYEILIVGPLVISLAGLLAAGPPGAIVGGFVALFGEMQATKKRGSATFPSENSAEVV